MSVYPDQIRSGVVLSVQNLARYVEALERVRVLAEIQADYQRGDREDGVALWDWESALVAASSSVADPDLKETE